MGLAVGQLSANADDKFADVIERIGFLGVELRSNALNCRHVADTHVVSGQLCRFKVVFSVFKALLDVVKLGEILLHDGGVHDVDNAVTVHVALERALCRRCSRRNGNSQHDCRRGQTD